MLQKAWITVLYSKVIMLEDNTIYLSLFHTAHSVSLLFTQTLYRVSQNMYADFRKGKICVYILILIQIKYLFYTESSFSAVYIYNLGGFCISRSNDNLRGQYL